MIKLAQIMKDRTYPESGSVLYDSIAPLLTRDEKVALDLDGVIALPSMFLNASIGMAANEFGADDRRPLNPRAGSDPLPAPSDQGSAPIPRRRSSTSLTSKTQSS